jgi:hypothetical protein
MTGLGPTGDVHRARDLAQRLLVDVPQRWRRTIAVARRAEGVADTVGPPREGDVLLAAAWLHDIGHAPESYETGFPPADAAHHLELLGWPPRIVALVAHHSAGPSVAIRRFPREVSPVADALTYADQTVGPDGRVIGLPESGPGSAAVDRVKRRLAELGRPFSAA